MGNTTKVLGMEASTSKPHYHPQIFQIRVVKLEKFVVMHQTATEEMKHIWSNFSINYVRKSLMNNEICERSPLIFLHVHRMDICVTSICYDTVEEAYRIMTISNDFTQFPESLDADGADEMVILEQATILRDAGFQISPLQTIPAQPQNPSPTRDVPIRSSGDAGSSNGNAHNNVTPVASSSAATPKDPLKDLFEERRRKMVERKEALERVKEKVKANKAQDLAKGVEGKTTPLSTTSRTMAELWELSSPFNFFLTKVHDIPDEKDGVFSANFTGTVLKFI